MTSSTKFFPIRFGTYLVRSENFWQIGWANSEKLVRKKKNNNNKAFCWKMKTLIIRKNNRITRKFSVKPEDLNNNVLYFYRIAQLVYKLHCISHWDPDNVFTDRSYKIMYFWEINVHWMQVKLYIHILRHIWIMPLQ